MKFFSSILILIILTEFNFYTGENKDEQKKKEQLPPVAANDSIWVPILVYHSVKNYDLSLPIYSRQYFVEPKNFEAEMKYLKDNHFETISFEELYNHLFNNYKLPEKPVIISFDDGWESQYQNAYPILKKYGFKATFFIFTNAISRKRYMSWDQIKELSANNMEIGSHSRFHPYLFKMTDYEQLTKEIKISKQIIEDNTKKQVVVFAYPFGSYNDQNIEVVKKSDYKIARALFKTSEQSKANIFTLGGIIVPNDLKEFQKVLTK